MDKLSKEFLIKIFSYLNLDDLCQLSSTCKLFNEIISNNSTLIDKFRLFYVNKNNDMKMMRKYQKIVVKTIDINLLRYLKYNGDNIYDLKIQCEDLELKDFRRILTLCQNVKQLNINIGKFTYSIEDLTRPVMKLALDSLTINSCDIFKILQIQAKNISVQMNHFSMNINDLVDLLDNQKQLKTLHLEEFRNWGKLFNDDSLAYADFQLQTFAVGFDCFHKLNIECFDKFLRNQKNLQRFIDRKILHRSDDFNYLNIVRNFENIKELEVSGPLDFLPSLPFVEKLKIEIIGGDKNNRNFHNLFPNLNELSIDSTAKIKFVENFTDCDAKDCLQIKISKNVKTITIYNIKFGNDSLFDDDVDIRIKNLTIYECDNIDWLIDCFKNDRIKLKSLTIERTNIKKSQREYLESLTRGDDKKIEKLKIYMWMKLDKNHDYVFSYLMEDKHDVKRIKLN